MYDKFKNELALQLNMTNIPGDDIRRMLQCLDIVSYNYDIKQKETQLVVYNNELPNLAKQFLVVKSIKGLAQGTLYGYKKHLELFFLQVKKDPTQVKKTDIEMYLYWFKKNRNVSDRSLDKVLDCLKSFFNWMYECGYIDRDPARAVESIKYEKNPKVSCSQTDLEYLRRACKTLKQKAILEFLYSTGCRVGELVILKKSDIDWDKKTVHLFGKGKKHRISFLNAKAEVALKEYLESRVDDSEWLFVSDRRPYNQMHVSGIERIMRVICSNTNGMVSKRVTPHVMRHTCASTLANNNSNIISVQKILGHSNVNTTMNYIHTSIDSAYADHLKSVV